MAVYLVSPSGASSAVFVLSFSKMRKCNSLKNSALKSSSIMSNQAVDVEILGEKLTRVNCPPGQRSLIAAAADLDNRLKEMAERTKVTNEVKLLTIAALNICSELQTKKFWSKRRTKRTDRTRMRQLPRHLSDVLSKVKHGQQCICHTKFTLVFVGSSSPSRWSNP